MLSAFYILLYLLPLVWTGVILFLFSRQSAAPAGTRWLKRALMFFALSVFYGFCGAVTFQDFEAWEWVIMRLLTLSGALYCFCRYAAFLAGTSPMKHHRGYLMVLLIISLLVPFLNLAIHIVLGSVTESEINWRYAMWIHLACLFIMALPGMLKNRAAAKSAPQPHRKQLYMAAAFPLCLPAAMMLLIFETVIPVIPFLFAAMYTGLYITMPSSGA